MDITRLSKTVTDCAIERARPQVRAHVCDARSGRSEGTCTLTLAGKSRRLCLSRFRTRSVSIFAHGRVIPLTLRRELVPFKRSTITFVSQESLFDQEKQSRLLDTPLPSCPTTWRSWAMDSLPRIRTGLRARRVALEAIPLAVSSGPSRGLRARGDRFAQKARRPTLPGGGVGLLRGPSDCSEVFNFRVVLLRRGAAEGLRRCACDDSGDPSVRPCSYVHWPRPHPRHTTTPRRRLETSRTRVRARACF